MKFSDLTGGGFLGCLFLKYVTNLVWIFAPMVHIKESVNDLSSVVEVVGFLFLIGFIISYIDERKS